MKITQVTPVTSAPVYKGVEDFPPGTEVERANDKRRFLVLKPKNFPANAIDLQTLNPFCLRDPIYAAVDPVTDAVLTPDRFFPASHFNPGDVIRSEWGDVCLRVICKDGNIARISDGRVEQSDIAKFEKLSSLILSE